MPARPRPALPVLTSLTSGISRTSSPPVRVGAGQAAAVVIDLCVHRDRPGRGGNAATLRITPELLAALAGRRPEG